MSALEPRVSLRAAFHVWHRNLSVYRKTWKFSILPNFFEPVLYLVAMGIGIGGYIREGIEGLSYLQYIAPGLIVSSSMNGATFEMTYNVFVKMHFGKTHEAITAAPVNTEDVLVGELLWAISRATVYGGIFAVVVACFGLVSPWRLPLLLPVVILTGWLFASIGLLFTSFISSIDLYSFYFTLWVTPLFLFSGIFFPITRLPDWAQTLAWATPLFHCVSLSKQVVHAGLDATSLVHLAYVIVMAAVCSVWAIRRVRARTYN
jgi:lipooligosaccharide transport system permease protein